MIDTEQLGDPYFFHDLSSYEKLIHKKVENIDPLTLNYTKEAMQAFLVNCLHSSAVMLGVALEYELDRLYETAQKSVFEPNFRNITNKQWAQPKFLEFVKCLESVKEKQFDEIKKDLDFNKLIISLIRKYRNESGHPFWAEELTREECYFNLQYFVHCCQWIYRLNEIFKSNAA